MRDAARLMKAGKMKQAESEVDKAIAADPSRRATYVNAMGLCYGYGRYQCAARVGEQMRELAARSKLDEKFDSEEWTAVYGSLADIHWKARNLDSAEHYFRLILKSDPKDPIYMNNLGYFLADENRNLQEALKLTQKAAKLRPDDGTVLDSLGWAQFRLKRYDEAQKTLLRAVALLPDSAEVRYHLGAAYSALGRKAEARVELRKSLVLDNNMTEAAILLKTLHN